MSTPIPAGTYRGPTVISSELAESPTKKTPYINVCFEVNGARAWWEGYFGENSTDRTLGALELMGYDPQGAGGDLSVLHKTDVIVGPQPNIDIVVEDASWENDQGVLVNKTRVAWVNDPNRASARKTMDDADAKSLSARLRAKVLRYQQKKGAPAPAPQTVPAGGGNPAFTNDDIPF